MSRARPATNDTPFNDFSSFRVSTRLGYEYTNTLSENCETVCRALSPIACDIAPSGRGAILLAENIKNLRDSQFAIKLNAIRQYIVEQRSKFEIRVA